MICAGDNEAAGEWSSHLVDLLQKQGKGHEAAASMLRGGKALFFNGEYEDAANILRQASLLSERLGDIELREVCEKFLEYTEFFLR